VITAIIQGAAIALLAGDWIYHRWFEDKPQKSRAAREVQVPTADVGSPVPLIYGRVRVRNPLLVWHDTPTFSSPYYIMNMFFVLGVGFDDNLGTNRVHNIWAGDWKLFWSQIGGTAMTGVGGPEAQVSIIGTGADGNDYGTGLLEFLDGSPLHVVAQDGASSGDAVTWAGRRMIASGIPVAEIPSYRGYITVLLHGSSPDQWIFGRSPSVPAYSFEVSSYRSSSSYPGIGAYAQVGQDSNPINVLYDLYVAKLSKAGISASVIDMPSWQSAAVKCVSESIGYSRYIENSAKLDDHIIEVLRVIDGVLRWNPKTGKIELKLIRPDFDPNTIPHITKDECSDITNFAFGGWTDVVNKVNIAFTNRALDYAGDVVADESPANAVRQDGENNEVTLQFPAICEAGQALMTAKREGYARSIPIMKFRAHVDSEFADDILQGDVVKVTVPRPPISGLYFRVADVDRGTIKDGKIQLDLITDTSAYVQGSDAPEPTTPAVDWRDRIDDIYDIVG
jgi:hypothetical protein